MRKAGLLSLLWLLLAAPAFATTLLWMDVQELTRHSNSVVMGTVQSQQDLTTHPGVPLNRMTFEISRTLKGDLEGTIVVDNPGFDGAPAFNEGEELILFIHTRSNTHVITGFQQGSFKIFRDASGNRVLSRGIPSHRTSIAGTRSVDVFVSEILDAAE
jgi:hypothetical protein